MSLRELKILAAVTVTTLLLALLTLSLKMSAQHDERLGQLWLDGLDVNAVHRIEITGPNNQEVALERRAQGWTVVQREHYPARISMIRTLLLDVSEARLFERKTDDAEQHAQLGLGKIGQPQAQGQQIKLIGGGVRVIRIGTQPSGRNATYVRHSNEEQAWLVDRTFTIPMEPRRWLEPELLDIRLEQMHRITITHADGEKVRGERDAEEVRFAPLNLPSGKVLKNEMALNRIASAITSLSLEDVMSATEAGAHVRDAKTRIEYDLYEGYILKAQLFAIEEQRYAYFTVQVKDGARQEYRDAAAALAARLEGWAFRIPSFAYDSMALRWADLTED